MGKTAIRAEGLSKKYRIGAHPASRTLRDTVAGALARPFHRFRSGKEDGRFSSKEPAIWAVKDLSFGVETGEVLGIIGRNGAGKSTLLKILSRITSPTEGYAEIHGHVRSLLEVGTGFHPELTGRENIFLNGAILGMKRAEIARDFDEIVNFAEVERFIDTPVKHYSSGMYLRLAFAVAAHLRSEILMVDEVLAVGDAVFQKKCLGKMGEVAHDGRTILFVSHNMAAIRTLCTRGLLLDGGRLAYTGNIQSVLFQYTTKLGVQDQQPSLGEGGLTGVAVNGKSPGLITSGEGFEVSCVVNIPDPMPGFRLFCIIQDVNGEPMVVAPTNNRQFELCKEPGSFRVSAAFPGLWLRTGIYSIHFKLLGSTAWSGSARFLSESIMLDVAGDDNPEALLGHLAPHPVWNCEALSATASSRIETAAVASKGAQSACF